MSTIGGAASATEFDKLISLAQFVQTDAYVERVKELHALETAATAAADHAAKECIKVEAQRKALAEERAKYDRDLAEFKQQRDTQRTDIARREEKIRRDLDSITTRESEFGRTKTAYDHSVEAYRRHVDEKNKELAAREEAVKVKERQVGQRELALNARVARIKAATDE